MFVFTLTKKKNEIEGWTFDSIFIKKEKRDVSDLLLNINRIKTYSSSFSNGKWLCQYFLFLIFRE